jgi:hypothetical protein
MDFWEAICDIEAEQLDRLRDFLSAHAAFLRELAGGGGGVRVLVSWAKPDYPPGFTITPELAGILGDVGGEVLVVGKNGRGGIPTLGQRPGPVPIGSA